jgi:hypothetical protein
VKKVLNIHKQSEETNLSCQNQDPEVDDFCCIHNILCGVLCGVFLWDPMSSSTMMTSGCSGRGSSSSTTRGGGGCLDDALLETCSARSELTMNLFEIVGDGGMGSEATHNGDGETTDLLIILQDDSAAN